MKTPQGVTAKLAQSVLAVRYETLPSSVVNKTKLMLLDSIGCALGAYVTERARIVLGLADVFGSRPQATAFGYKKLPGPVASFVNGELINCLDFGAIGPLCGHVAEFVIPTVLALAEEKEANGKDLVTALAIAIEVGGRAAGALPGLKWPKDDPPYFEEALRSSHNPTVFGAVAGGCWLLGMSEAQLRGAMGIVGTTTPIPGHMKWEYLEEGSNVNLKYGCWSGWVAMLGTVAVLATQRGFTGDPTIFDGKYGFWQMYGSPFFAEDVLLGDLGKTWRLDEASFKYYPCCYINHSAIEGIERLVRENRIKPEDIDEIVVYGDPLMNTPNRQPKEVTTQEDAQFANTYLYALAACHEGLPGPQWQSWGAINDPVVRDLMPRVRVKVHPRAEEIATEKFKARGLGGLAVFFNSIVEIRAKGRKFTTEVPVPKGSAGNPMSTAEIERKFRHNATFSLVKRDKVEQIIETVGDLEKLGSVARLTDLLAVAR